MGSRSDVFCLKSADISSGAPRMRVETKRSPNEPFLRKSTSRARAKRCIAAQLMRRAGAPHPWEPISLTKQKSL
jgi:hypothetical protein